MYRHYQINEICSGELYLFYVILTSCFGSQLVGAFNHSTEGQFTAKS